MRGVKEGEERERVSEGGKGRSERGHSEGGRKGKE